MEAAGSPEQAKKKATNACHRNKLLNTMHLKVSILWQAFLCFLSARGKALA